MAVFKCPEPGKTLGLANIEEDPIHFYTLTVLSPEACGITASAGALIGSTATDWKDHCVRQVQRWWTLEVCPGHRVRQYHKEVDGSITSVVLGEFESTKSELHPAQPDKNQQVRHTMWFRVITHTTSGHDSIVCLFLLRTCDSTSSREHRDDGPC